MTCENCAVQISGAIYGSGRFCSQKCARSFATKDKRKEINAKVSKKLRRNSYFCEVCGQDASWKAKGTWRFCVEHKHKHGRDLTWDELKKDGTRKVRLLKERGHRCERCGITDWMNEKAPIELDHVDGNPDNCAKENMRLLCPNCHAQAPTNAGKNIGKHPSSVELPA